jgi:enoyl-CoA hydratase/carnithine racemase
MSDGEVHFTVADGVASIVFDRPQARNAMTWAMYDRLADACARIAADTTVRVATLRGAGGNFVAGTDIGQFTSFVSPEDGIAYERRMEAVIAALEALPVPTVAVIEGAAMGGGMMIATVCDIRIAVPGARMGVPIARTLGNCLSMANTARLAAALGTERARRVLLLADEISADEALACGFVARIAAPEAIEEAVTTVCRRLAANAPITMRVAKESIRRLSAAALPDGDDLVRLTYGSEDFRAGVRAFLAKERPLWRGR